MRLFCFGFGYSAEALARRLSARTSALARHQHQPRRSRRRRSGPSWPRSRATAPPPRCAACWPAPRTCSSACPPDLEGDMVLRHFRDELAGLPELAWVGYLSTVGVYGDWQGQWVDETSPTRPTSERSLRRVLAEKAWLAFGAESGRRVEVFRLSGIYGPGRSVIDNLKAGTARRIVKPGQVFNRIHVDDIARVLAAAIDTARRPQRSTTSATTSRRRRRMSSPMPRSCWDCPSRPISRSSRPASAAWRPASGPRASASAMPASRPLWASSSPIRPTARVCAPSWRVGKVSRTLARAGAVRQCQRSADFSELSFVCFTMIIIHRTSTRSMANTKPRSK